jgi:hypothetical protein
MDQFKSFITVRGNLLGVIDSLSAGYRFVGRRLYLLIIPVLLDLLLWMLPRLSVASLFESLATFYEQALSLEGMSSDVVDMAAQAAAMLREMGQQSNLLNMLVSNSLLHVPSLMVMTGALPGALVYNIENALVAVGTALGVSGIGVLIGVIYLGLLAHHLPLGTGERTTDPLRFLRISGRRWALVILFLFLTAFTVFAIYIPATIGIALTALVIPVLSSLLAILLGGVTFILFFYLYFVIVGLILDDLSIFDAVVSSIKLVRNNFWSTLGFLILINVISLGFALLLMPAMGFSPFGTLLAILINAYIGTGLSTALLVYYRSRLLKMEELNNK